MPKLFQFAPDAFFGNDDSEEGLQEVKCEFLFLCAADNQHAKEKPPEGVKQVYRLRMLDGDAPLMREVLPQFLHAANEFARLAAGGHVCVAVCDRGKERSATLAAAALIAAGVSSADAIACIRRVRGDHALSGRNAQHLLMHLFVSDADIEQHHAALQEGR
jgi:protein-tyrosine phosphatase